MSYNFIDLYRLIFKKDWKSGIEKASEWECLDTEKQRGFNNKMQLIFK